MNVFQAIVLGIIEGLTEFLPVSSTGHLTIAEKLMGFSIADPDITAFTAIVQVGAVVATLLYFREDFRRILAAWFRGLTNSAYRTDPSYRFGWAIILGSLPIALVGLALKHTIETTARSLWVVAGALLIWSAVMWYADRKAKQNRHEDSVTWGDALIIGFTQCLALIPGVSRSGATISAGILRGFDRVAATRLSFFLAIPALLAAAALESIKEFSRISGGVGWPATIIATITSFMVAYLAIAWLLKYVARHDFTFFIIYRTVIGLLLIVALSTGVLSPH